MHERVAVQVVRLRRLQPASGGRGVDGRRPADVGARAGEAPAKVAGAARRRRRRTEETYASSDEEASQLLVAFLESARNRRVPSIAEDDGGWGDASGSDADAS